MSRVITLTQTAGFTTASHSIDPSDELDYVIDLSALLETGEQFTSVAIAVDAASAVLGFSIPTTGEYALVEVDDSHIRIWPKISSIWQNNAIYSASGTTCKFEITAETNSAPSRTWQKSVQIPVSQK